MSENDGGPAVSSTRLLGTPDSSGWIPPGETCAYSDECRVKRDACNGDGCPVCDGKIIGYRFSCGWARFIKICKRPNKALTGGQPPQGGSPC